MRASVLKLDWIKNVDDKAQRALRALGSFVKAAKLNYKDIGFNIDLETEPGVADTGDLNSDLTDLMKAVGEAASPPFFARRKN